jgi:hypothetical protein
VSLPLIVHGHTPNQISFREETHTLVVNSHGGLISLSTNVKQGQKLILKNKTTQEEQGCRVVFVGPKQGEKNQVGVDFLRPAPEFWHIAFPPDDWKPVQD